LTNGKITRSSFLDENAIALIEIAFPTLSIKKKKKKKKKILIFNKKIKKKKKKKKIN